jgi:DNA-binding NarL/FixJ family response regulator
MDEDDPAGAVGHAERFLRHYDSERPIEVAPGLELLVRAYARLGNLDSAGEAYGELQSIATAVGTSPLRAEERVAAAAIAATRDEWEVARLALEDAVELYRASPAPFEAAVARLDLARALEALELPGRALEEAVVACDVLEALGAEREARRAGKVVAALGGRSAALKRAGLTPREFEVLSLVAEGLSNRQVAERLIVSEHTVHRHLANVYAKLGVSSRTAAVALVTQRELL